VTCREASGCSQGLPGSSRRLTSLCTLAKQEGGGDANNTRGIGYQAAGPLQLQAVTGAAPPPGESEPSQGGREGAPLGEGPGARGGIWGPLSSRQEEEESGPPPPRAGPSTAAHLPRPAAQDTLPAQRPSHQ